MKILQTTFRYYPATGGVEDYVRRISEGLTDRGHKTAVFTSSVEEDFHYTKVKDAPTLYNGVQIRRFRSSLRFKNYVLLPLMPAALLMEQADLVHAHSYMYFAADAAAICAKIKKIPVVFNPYLADTGPASVFGRFYRKTLGSLLMNSDVVVVISDYERELIYKWGYKPKNIQKIPPGVDIKEFEEVQHDIYENYGADNKLKILYAGRLAASKGVETLVKAFSAVNKNIPEAELFIAGPDFGEKNNLQKLAQNLNIEQKIHFLDKLSRADLISAFKGADVFVLPSRYEAFGIVLIEAFAAKTPVIAARNSAIAYVVNENKTGLLFETDNYNELSEKMINLLKNEKEKERLINNAYEDVLKNYSWKNTIEKMEKVYSNLI